jgi:hypothetical protein
MGTLVVMRYPSKLFADLADHTYVECGTGGEGWSCWGGKTGGGALRQGAGGTKRADAIARPNERAGITCYLINGVCHQAANRILLPAGITVRGARGYDVSEALFGTYGRPRGAFGTCRAPFDRHAGVTGDLRECAEDTAKASLSTPERRAERKYLRGVLAIYRKAERRLKSARGLTGPDLERLLLELFMHKVRFSLGRRLDRSLARKLRDIRASTERSRMKLEEWFARGEMRASAFVAAFNTETILFQEAVAGVLKADQYRALFGLRRGDTVILADPRIVRRAYRGR